MSLLWFMELMICCCNCMIMFLLAPLVYLFLKGIGLRLILFFIPRRLPINRRRQWHPTPALLPGKFHGWRSLVGCSPWGCEESDTTERLHFNFSLSCIGEGNGNSVQCSCLENPRDGGAWWAAIYGVAQSRTWLKRLSKKQKLISDYWILKWVMKGQYNV